MIPNRSVPRSTVIPVLAHDDANVAADWLLRAFGFIWGSIADVDPVNSGGEAVELD